VKRHYLSFLLRLWKTSHHDDTVDWFASIEDPHTRQVIYFHNLASLWQYLQDRIALERQSDPNHPDETAGDIGTE
jgi:hypothetical protein